MEVLEGRSLDTLEIDGATHGKVDQARDLIELSQQAEASGVFDALWVGDSLLANSLATLRERGARIAIDDAGSGYASLQSIAELRPNFLKVANTLITGLNQDTIKPESEPVLREIAHLEDAVGRVAASLRSFTRFAPLIASPPPTALSGSREPIELLVENGFVVDALHELRPGDDAASEAQAQAAAQSETAAVQQQALTAVAAQITTREIIHCAVLPSPGRNQARY